MYNKNKLLLIVYSRAPSLLLYGVMSVVNGTHNITCKLYVEEHGLKVVGRNEESQYSESTALAEQIVMR